MKKDNKYNIKYFKSSSGLRIIAGRDDRSNDYVTFVKSEQNDLWFHVKGESGSHVVLKCSDSGQEPDKISKYEAASVAAWFSKLKKGGKVAVTTCRIKDVKKIKGSPPGMVSVKKSKTLKIIPKSPENLSAKNKDNGNL